jgi:hypothetical protein
MVYICIQFLFVIFFRYASALIYRITLQMRTEMHVGLHAERPLLLPDVNRISNMPPGFSTVPQCQIL